ncbi:MAG: exosortase-associated EpsI family protein [Verrucomicrobiota bacterium]|jgi:hypothetical protein
MKKQTWSMFAVVLVLILAGGAFLMRLQQGQKLGKPGVVIVAQPMPGPDGKPACPERVELPSQVPGFEARLESVSAAELAWLPKDTTYGKMTYTAPDGFRVAINTVVMGTDRGSIHKPEICLTGQGWKIDHSELVTIPVQRPHRYDLQAMKLTATARGRNEQGEPTTFRALFVYWFVADGQLTASHWERMWWMGRDLIRDGTLQRWAYIAYFNICYPGQESASYARMEKFISETVPEFQRVSGPALNAGSSEPNRQAALRE